MNQHDDQQDATEVDPQVSDLYESLAAEKTPADLDQVILREAARALRADNHKGSFGAWFRPAAFVATVGLSLAIILEISDTGIFGPAADMSLETMPPAQAPPGPAADSSVRNAGQTSLNEIKRQEKSAPAPRAEGHAPDARSQNAGSAMPQTTITESRQSEQGQSQKMRPEIAPAQAALVADQAPVSDALTTEAEGAGQRFQKLERALDAKQRARPATHTQIGAPRADIATAASAAVPATACSDEQKSDVEEWWKCIQSLRHSGLAAAADLEFDRLMETFPDFVLPE